MLARPELLQLLHLDEAEPCSEDHGDLKNARVIMRKASLVPYKVVDDLAAVWMG